MDVNRLWRVRRRTHRIDAVLRRDETGWELTFLRNDRRLMSEGFETKRAAVQQADRRLRELQRAGWTVHW